MILHPVAARSPGFSPLRFRNASPRLQAMTGPILRDELEGEISSRLEHYPIVSILGARQVGKTSLGRRFATSPDHHFDLENSIQRIALEENAFNILDSLKGTVVIDEIQEMPSLFQLLRVLADREDSGARFIILGSVSPGIVKGIGESLAGRVSLLEIGGFTLTEIGSARWRDLWLRGSYPKSFLAPSEEVSLLWREDYLEALLHRDLRIWSNLSLQPGQARRLLTLVADQSGRSWNHSSASRHLGVDSKTINSYIELLKGVYLLRELPLFDINVGKRLRKAPTLHLCDSGIMSALLGIDSMRALERSPKMGHSWETFCVDQIIRILRVRPDHCFTYSEQSGAEIDLIVKLRGRTVGFEIKRSENATPKKSDRELAGKLGLSALYWVRQGTGRHDLGDNLISLGIEELPKELSKLRKNSQPTDEINSC